MQVSALPYVRPEMSAKAVTDLSQPCCGIMHNIYNCSKALSGRTHYAKRCRMCSENEQVFALNLFKNSTGPSCHKLP